MLPRLDTRRASAATARYSPRRRPWARLRLVAVLLIGVLLVALLAWLADTVGTTLNQTQELENQVSLQFSKGQQDLEAGRTLLGQATSEGSPDKARQAQLRFASAHQEFTRARQIVDQSQLVERWEGFGPIAAYVKPRREAVDRLADASIAVTIASQSFFVIAIGFSRKMCLPALAAAIAIGA